MRKRQRPRRPRPRWIVCTVCGNPVRVKRKGPVPTIHPHGRCAQKNFRDRFKARAGKPYRRSLIDDGYIEQVYDQATQQVRYVRLKPKVRTEWPSRHPKKH